jgi:hypothetical protein
MLGEIPVSSFLLNFKSEASLYDWINFDSPINIS